MILREDKTRLRFLYQRWVFRERPITNLSNQLMLEEEQNLEYLQERERSVAQLEADIGDVNQIFKDLAAMVHDQVI